MKAYVLVEYCCMHYAGVYSSYEAALKSRFETVEQMEAEGYDILERDI